jgi:hypothetical protein
MVRTRSKSKKRVTRRAPVRRSTPKKKTVKRKTTTTVKLAPLEQRQLAVFHNPFSNATKQPKIPDGKASESLGFKTQAVTEVQNLPGGDGMIHMILYPGCNACVCMTGDAASDAAFSANKYNVVGFTDSNDINWSTWTTSGGTANRADTYALWRVVSCGLKLALLNPEEENDGWWEAIRINASTEITNYALLTKDCSGTRTAGVLAPTPLIDAYDTATIVNERSYTTGLLKDIDKVAFTLNGVMDHHDFKRPNNYYDCSLSDVGTVDLTNMYALFDEGRGQGPAAQMRDDNIDSGYDMIYIRIHGKTGSIPTRLHVNAVSNQEIAFGDFTKESRFHTAAANIGLSNAAAHATARRSNYSAAKPMVVS